MIVLAKGAGLEELARAFFARQGFVAIRSVSVQFEEEEVTDVDVWLYGRPGGGVRTRALVDVKDKKSPKAFERVMWARGMQLALGCDRAIVTTTDASSKVARFAQQQRVSLLTSAFLRRWAGDSVLHDRLSLEEFTFNVQSYPGQKQDGDWIKLISSAKSAIISLSPFPAFNKAMSSFRFFAERADTRPQHREQALRCALLSAALACVALDAALEKLVFEEQQARYNVLHSGVTYGDAGDSRVKASIETVLSVISKSVENGRVLARQTSDVLEKLFAGVRAEIIAEFFQKEHNSSLLFPAARELEARAHVRNRSDLTALSLETKSILGVFADFVGAKRTALLSPDFIEGARAPPSSKTVSPEPTAAAGTTALDGSLSSQTVMPAGVEHEAMSGTDVTEPISDDQEKSSKLL